MAGIATIATGHDPGYYTQASKGAEYYSASAGAAGMEPDGTWAGDGCQELGLTPGAAIDPDVFVKLFGEHLDPRSGERLGRAMSRYADWRAGYAEALAMEPEATAERRAELKDRAKAQVRQAVQYFDVTFSPSKDVSLLHASFMASAAAALDEGDIAAAAYWQTAAEDVWACVSSGAQAMLDYLQEHAGYTRSGYHGTSASGASSGRWEDAHGWVAASFRQHTSRAGDPQLHIHNTILNRVKRERDGQWRTIDGKAIYRERGAAAAQGALIMENALTNVLGVEWAQRADGHGREIKGISQAVIDEFSTRRRQEIEGVLLRLIDTYRAQHGFDPDAHALGSLRQLANKLSRAAKDDDGAGELMAHVRGWAQQARRSGAQALEPLGAAVSNRKGPGAEAQAQDSALARPVLTPGQEYRLMTGALDKVQAAQSTWTRSALHRALGEMLPAYTGPMGYREAGGLLPALTDRVLAGEVGAVVMLAAPEWPVAPASLRRKNGESVFAPHQAQLYATESQLALEERILTIASRRCGAVPRLAPAQAAAQLGTDVARLEAQLDQSTGADVATVTDSGLRMDQAAAAYRLLTSDRRVEVLVGPAGTGKTRTVGVMAQAWLQVHPGSRVLGLSATQQAANMMAREGLEGALNIDMFLTRRQDQEGLEGALIIIDEGSMVKMDHYAEVLRIAEAAGAKVVVTGDPAQLGAVGQAGGMMMIARRLGWVQLGEPLRYHEEWQREASLRLRAGDASVLTEYDQRGRLRYGTREEMIEAAYRYWLADYMEGRHSALIAHDEADANELSRRARADLKHYGRVSASGEVRLRNGAGASAGDRIMARDNDHRQEAGVPGRTLSNRDVLQVLRTDAGGGRAVEVRLLLGRDAEGTELWGAPFMLTRNYLAGQCHLAYGVTTHSVEGATFGDNAYCLVRASDDRRTLYTGMSRARADNIAFVIGETRAPDASDATTARPGRPAEADPEIARSRALARERSGEMPAGPAAEVDGDAGSVLAQVVRRNDAGLAAGEALNQAYSDADHLADFGHRWMELVKDESTRRFSQVLQDELPAHLTAGAMGDAALTWLFRDLRAAELAGADGEALLQRAIGLRDMTGARDVARVLHGRVRTLTRGSVPLAGRSWASRVPDVADPEMARYLRELAEAIDARIARLGEHTAETEPVWATRTLGAVPDDPSARADWERRAGSVAAYREMHGYENPGDPIGPEPARTSPEARHDWHGALAALGSVDGADLLGVPDETLEMRRGLYEKETAWAPEHVGDQLRLARMTVTDARARAARAEHEGQAAQTGEARTEHARNKEIWDAMLAKAYEEMTSYEKAEAARREWQRVTEATRRMALAADLELQRRHPDRARERLQSAEPATRMERIRAQATAEPADQAELPGMEREPEPQILTTRQEDERMLSVLGLTPATAAEPVPEHVHEAAGNAQATEEILAALRSMPEPGEAEDDMSPGEAWAAVIGRQRDSVLQPAGSLVPPAPQLTQPEADYELEAEA